MRALRGALLAIAALTITVLHLPAQSAQPESVPPRVQQARRFLAQRGWPRRRSPSPAPPLDSSPVAPQPSASASTAIWQPLGPSAVISPSYGLVTGRISSIAIDPADPTGNHVFVGATGGGVWSAQNAASSGSVVFSPLTEAPSAFDAVRYASISIGALTVQPGGTGVILAGTGDPNDALDSYYGAGILRSTDGGNTWSLVPRTADLIFVFQGEGFSGFAWSTTNPQLVVAAVSQAYEGTLVNAQLAGTSYAGLYYSTDAGATWSLATITDSAGQDVQGPLDMFAAPNGNSVTAVVWNPLRRIFVAAVRFHGYYQSSDGIHWTRMTAQPGSGLTARMCPTNPGAIGSAECPIFRGALAVNPQTGDTFAWTVDLNNQDQGLWQDQCAIAAGACSNQTVAFAQRWSTTPLESTTQRGTATIANGDYNLVLAAIPSAQDTLLVAGANDVWKCSLAMGCAWRNTTNANTCMSARVAPYQHALAWNPANPQELYIGNDGGLWLSTDAIGESGPVCSPADASHFDNLNAGIGSLAEVESMSQVRDSPYTMMAGLGVNGTAGINSTNGPTPIWPRILSGEGGPVAIDPLNPSNWYVNNGPGVSIYRCSGSAPCTPAAFGATPVVNNADVAGDGSAMTSPAPFLIDPLDVTHILVGTCRLWRGPADGTGWASQSAISPILDGIASSSCNGNALIRSIAALPLPGGKEVIYVGMYGAFDGGAKLAGHVLKAPYDPAATTMPVWQDLTFNPVANDQVPFNYYGLDISSIFVDPHDATGNTVYVTVAGAADSIYAIRTIYRTTDGGADWEEIMSNLPQSPVNSVVIDPQDANTAYIATDEGVYATREVAVCGTGPVNCWTMYGAGLPYAPVVQLSAAPPATSPSVLVAGTYGRGIWQIPLFTAGAQLTTASFQPASLTFPSQAVGTTSSAQTITLTNTGGIALAGIAVAASPNFSEIDNCSGNALSTGAGCSIQVSFTPGQAGAISGQITINANLSNGPITIPLTGTGSAAGLVTASPVSLDFGQVPVGTTSPAQPVTIENAGAVAVPISTVVVTPPFALAANACGSPLPPNSDCALSLAFAPTQPGAATGTLTLTDAAGTQTVALRGIGAAAATDVLSPGSISFPATIAGQQSSAQIVTLTNNGDMPLTSIAITASAGFQALSTCGTSLTGHASCAISVLFAPTTPGNLSGTIRVSDAIQTQTVALSGTALQPPVIAVLPSQLTFSAQPIGQAASPLTLTISNAGGAPMSNVGFQISGPSAASFFWTGSTCGPSLSNGASCTVQVGFNPAFSGQLAASLIVSSSTPTVTPVSVPLSGIGQSASGITITPAQMTLIQSTIAQPSAPQTATITNTSGIAATGLVVSTSSPFSLVQSTCPSTLASGASCTASVVFTPAANGSVTGALTASSSSFSNPARVVLTGIGGAAGSLLVQPASLDFPATGIGATSSSQTVTFTNNGPIALGVLSLFISDGFQIASSTCGASLAAGATCAAQVAFAPMSAGQQTGNLTASSSAIATSTQVALNGMGFDFAIAAQGQSGQTIASGQTASFVITLAPMSGSSGTFSIACSALPAHSACAFNPASESVPANTSGSVAVHIATGVATSSAQNTAPPSTSHLHEPLFLACGILMLPLAFRRKQAGITFMLLLFITIAGIASCSASGGGGGSGPINPANSNTPPGTYSVVVTATSGGISHKVTLTLTVD